MPIHIRLIAAGLATCLLVPAAAGLSDGSQGIRELEERFRRPPDDCRPMMRWWWFGPSVTREQLEVEMKRMKEGGIGGFEVQPVYPLALDDPERGLRNLRYLSPEFLELVGFAARKARELGLRMDMTLGSGWPFGGPHIPLKLAAGRLRSDRLAIAPGAEVIARPTPYEGEQLTAGFVARGAPTEMDPSSFRELDLSGGGPIPLPPGEGPRTAVFYFSSHTGQAVKRAAYGAEGYVLDHYSREAIETHLREIGDRLVTAAGPGGLHAVFCDSLEVYGSDWPADMLYEFRQRRGYDLRPLLPLLEYEAGARADVVRRDFGRTLTELYVERFLVPMREWTRINRVLFRIQNYGVPPASLASHRYADLYEGEGWHWRALTATRWASSAGHLYGKPVISSETWTWIHSPVFRATPLDLKAEADQHFLTGVNQLIGHGWPYSPPQAGAPGWSFYAAGVFNDKNPWWPVMPDLALYLQRLSCLLRQGEPVADIALYAPTEDAWSTFRTGAQANVDLYRKTADWIGPKVIPAILDAGFNFDLLDDAALLEAVSRYKAVVLPAVRWMPEETRRRLEAYSRNGGKVIAVRRKPEQAWPSVELVDEPGLAGRLASATGPDLVLDPATPEIGFVHRRLADGDIYFLANTGSEPRRVSARFRVKWPHAEIWDALSGKALRVDSAGSRVSLDFEPYGSHVVVFRRDPCDAPLLKPASVLAAEGLSAGWSVSLGGIGEQTGVGLPHSWAEDARTRYFSGTATYRREVQVRSVYREPGVRVYLDFGEAKSAEREPRPGGRPWAPNIFAALVAPPIRDAATVFVNGKRAGSVWCPPYRIEVTDLLRDGHNELRIEVYNTAINQLAEGGRLPDYGSLVERYGLRFRMQDMENLEPLASGIVSVLRLVAER